MISVRPGSPGFRALALIGAYPGEIGVEELAAHLWPRPVRRDPFPSAATPEGRREFIEWRRGVFAHDVETRARASRLVRYLAHAGYCESRGAPVLADWFVGKAERLGVERALRSARPGPTTYEGSVALHLRLIGRVTEGPTSCADVTGANPSGHVKRAWRDLDRWGVVVLPRRRWLTERGVAVFGGAA